MTKYRAALIGTGAIAREHLAALREMPEVEIGGVCDRSAAIAEMTAERFGVGRWYTDFQRMLEEVKPDLVHVTTPPDSHYPLARACLERGFHVLCEKPITVEYDQFVSLRRVAEDARRTLFENQNLRCHSSIRRIQELIAGGELGEVVDVQVQLFLDISGPGSRFADPNVAHPCLAMRGGAIADFLTHLAYLAYIFTGAPRSLRTLWDKRIAGSILPADEFRALIQGERATGSILFSASARPNGFWVRVIGTKMQAETNLFDPPRLAFRRLRGGAPPLASLFDGLAEAREVRRGSIRALGRKLGGTARYDGLPEFISRAYASLDAPAESPVPIEEIDVVARMVAAFTDPERAL